MMETQNQLIIPLTKIGNKEAEYSRWLLQQGIEHKCVKIFRQAPSWPSGWECYGPALEFNNIEDAMAFKLRWL